jgi:hypothetical protein
LCRLATDVAGEVVVFRTPVTMTRSELKATTLLAPCAPPLLLDATPPSGPLASLPPLPPPELLPAFVPLPPPAAPLPLVSLPPPLLEATPTSPPLAGPPLPELLALEP